MLNSDSSVMVVVLLLPLLLRIILLIHFPFFFVIIHNSTHKPLYIFGFSFIPSIFTHANLYIKMGWRMCPWVFLYAECFICLLSMYSCSPREITHDFIKYVRVYACDGYCCYWLYAHKRALCQMYISMWKNCNVYDTQSTLNVDRSW